ncbi:stage II sporulation protein GA (sporulation sigma-E factor processing peptidase) [Peribacillus deserti]|uniref:Sporulation sigma-E factor-processing peptidase n=2 Tax=Peribacillus deserti TaxID=673318 RepID=A0ABS2QGU1_9BACI|nr:stage II sporulation protein GA (sporulation sigma-E factor processing peptidase) [Peribacillus deserti]
MVMYLDVIWLLNLLFDSLLLTGAALMLKRKVSVVRIGAGGFIGSIIIILNFTPLYAWAEHPLTKLIFSIAMTLAAFGYRRLKYFVKGLMALYLITFLLGGTMLGVHYLFQSNITSVQTKVTYLMNGFGDPVSWLFVIIGFPVSWIFSKRNLDSLEMTKIKFEKMVKVLITIDDFTVTATGLVDSGNQLYDPLTQAPVMIFSLKGYEEQIPVNMLHLLQQPECIMESGAVYDLPWAGRLRLIPSKVIGADQQILPAFKPDSVQIYVDDGFIDVKKCLVSFTLQQLSPEMEYAAIIHPKMMVSAKKSVS